MHFHIFHNAPYLPHKILHNLCFSFLLGITAVPREIENNAYAKFGGQIRCIMGNVEMAYVPEFPFWFQKRNFPTCGLTHNGVISLHVTSVLTMPPVMINEANSCSWPFSFEVSSQIRLHVFGSLVTQNSFPCGVLTGVHRQHFSYRADTFRLR